MGILSGARAAIMAPVRDFIDSQVTKELKPYLEIGIGPDGEQCSDFVVDEAGDVSIENMIVQPSVANATLIKKGLPYRVVMLRCKRIAVDIPWENMSGGNWKLDVDGLQAVIQPLERSAWSIDDLRKAKESAVEAALAGLIKKLKSLEAKSKPSGLMLRIKRSLLSHVNVNGEPRAGTQGQGVCTVSNEGGGRGLRGRA